jgi:hypothetical protein
VLSRHYQAQGSLGRLRCSGIMSIIEDTPVVTWSSSFSCLRGLQAEVLWARRSLKLPSFIKSITPSTTTPLPQRKNVFRVQYRVHPDLTPAKVSHLAANSKKHIKCSNNGASKAKGLGNSGRSRVLRAAGSRGRGVSRRGAGGLGGAGGGAGLGDVELLRLGEDTVVGGAGSEEIDLVLGAGGSYEVGEGVFVVGRVDEVADDGLLGTGSIRVIDQDDGEVGWVVGY